jgi:hypothetical protein
MSIVFLKKITTFVPHLLRLSMILFLEGQVILLDSLTTAFVYLGAFLVLI